MALRRATDSLRDQAAEYTSWVDYVASWPVWRDFEVCGGDCLHADVCGRARVCVREPACPYALVHALARLSMRLGERAPARTGPD